MRRFAEATSVEQLLVKATNWTGKLDGYTNHLHARLQAGVTDAVALHAELRQRGFTASVQTVRRFLHPLRDTAPYPPHPPNPVPPRPEVPKPRHLTRWIMTDPPHLNGEHTGVDTEPRGPTTHPPRTPLSSEARTRMGRANQRSQGGQGGGEECSLI